MELYHYCSGMADMEKILTRRERELLRLKHNKEYYQRIEDRLTNLEKFQMSQELKNDIPKTIEELFKLAYHLKNQVEPVRIIAETLDALVLTVENEKRKREELETELETCTRLCYALIGSILGHAHVLNNPDFVKKIDEKFGAELSESTKEDCARIFLSK